MHSLRSDPKFYHQTPEDLMEDFKNIIKDKIAPNLKKLFSQEPTQKLE